MAVTKIDRILLKKISENQELLRSTMKELQISSPGDLNNIHAIMRRGMVQTVGDIFELTKELDEEILSEISLSQDIIKSFRNTASHRYGQITNEFAYACITHCADKDIMKKIREQMNL